MLSPISATYLPPPDEVAALSPEVIVLPDEPYHFTAEDDARFSVPTIHVTGRSLFWVRAGDGHRARGTRRGDGPCELVGFL